MKMRMCIAGMLVIMLSMFIVPNSFGASSSEIQALKQQIQQIERQRQVQIESLKERIEELEATQEKMPNAKEMAKIREGWWNNVKAGYHHGLYFKTNDGNWALKFNTRFQFRFFADDFDNARDKNNDYSFQMRRLRLQWSGHGFRPWIKYKVQVAADEGKSLFIKDYLLDLTYFKEASLRLGQYKVPFSAEQLTSSSALEFVDRSIADSEFALKRDIGIDLHGRVKNVFEYNAGIYNGTGRNEKENGDNDFIYVARVAYFPFGHFKYSQADLGKHSETPLLRIAAAVAGIPGLEPAKEQTGGKAGARCEDLGATKCDVVQFTTDAVFKWMGFSTETEFDVRNTDPADSGIDGAFAWGLRTQAGYVFRPTNVGVAFRFAYVDPDKDVDNNSKWELTPAVSYYIYGHRLKVQGDYSFLREEDPDTGNNLDDNRVRLQLQFYF